MDAERRPLPTGLSSHLSVGKEGYEALCSLLRLDTTQQRKDIAFSRHVRQRLRIAGKAPDPNARQAEKIRHNLLAFYSDPDVRLLVWQQRNRARNAASDGGRAPLPSLEHAALSRYDVALLEEDSEPENLGDIEAFYDPDITEDKWRAPAFAAMRG